MTCIPVLYRYKKGPRKHSNVLQSTRTTAMGRTSAQREREIIEVLKRVVRLTTTTKTINLLFQT